MNRKLLLLIVALLALGAGAWAWFHKETGVTNGTLTLYGNVDIRRVSLGFRVPGRLAEVAFEEGDALAAGAVVARLDRAPYEQELAQAEAQVRQHEAALTALSKEADRREVLVASGAVTDQSLDDVTSRRAQTQAALDSARASLALAKIRLSDTELLAPQDGVLLTRVQEPGAMVGVGQTVMVQSLTNPIWVRAYIPEPDLGLVHPGQTAQVWTDSRPDQPYRGHVGFISPEAEFTPKNVQTPKLRTDLVFRVRIIVDDPDQGLRQGMPVTVTLEPSATEAD